MWILHYPQALANESRVIEYAALEIENTNRVFYR